VGHTSAEKKSGGEEQTFLLGEKGWIRGKGKKGDSEPEELPPELEKMEAGHSRKKVFAFVKDENALGDPQPKKASHKQWGSQTRYR